MICIYNLVLYHVARVALLPKWLGCGFFRFEDQMCLGTFSNRHRAPKMVGNIKLV